MPPSTSTNAPTLVAALRPAATPRLQRSSGKGYGLPLRYPSMDGPLSARGPSAAAGLASLAAAEDDASSDGGASCEGSPPRAAAAAGFALLAEGSDDEAAEEESIDEELPAAEQQQQRAGDSVYESEAEAEEGTRPAPAAAGGAFSFGWAPLGAPVSPGPHQQQQQQPGAAQPFSFASAAGGTAPAPPSQPCELPPGTGHAGLRASGVMGASAGLANAESSEDDALFFSAVPSRATSAALTAYTSARSLRCGTGWRSGLLNCSAGRNCGNCVV